jgi:hypothetical protein
MKAPHVAGLSTLAGVLQGEQSSKLNIRGMAPVFCRSKVHRGSMASEKRILVMAITHSRDGYHKADAASALVF